MESRRFPGYMYSAVSDMDNVARAAVAEEQCRHMDGLGRSGEPLESLLAWSFEAVC